MKFVGLYDKKYYFFLKKYKKFVKKVNTFFNKRALHFKKTKILSWMYTIKFYKLLATFFFVEWTVLIRFDFCVLCGLTHWVAEVDGNKTKTTTK